LADEITYNLEAHLAVPEDVATDNIKVRVTIEPVGAGVIIYGYDAFGGLQPVQIMNSGVVELPFVNPQIYVRYLDGVSTFQWEVVGWSESRGKPRPRSAPPDEMIH
jgi:hypothetical protein